MKALNKVDQINRSANPKQRILLAFLVPIGIMLIGYGIMRIVNANSWELVHRFGFCNPSDLNESWWGWLLILILVGIYEWRLLGLGNLSQMTTVSAGGSAHVICKDQTTGQEKYAGSYIKNPAGPGGTAVFGKDATALTMIQMFLMHVAEMAPPKTKSAFCEWAGISEDSFSGEHRALFANAFLHYLQELRTSGTTLPSQYETLMPDLMNQELPPLPRQLTPQFREQIHQILFGPS